jgi:hypothetical protein
VFLVRCRAKGCNYLRTSWHDLSACRPAPG